jgi:MFS family permease
MAIMAAVTTKQTRGGSMGVYTTMRMVGFAIGPLLGGVIVVHLGFNAAFATGVTLIFIVMGLVQMWVKDVPVRGPGAGARNFKHWDREIYTPGLVALSLATFVMAGAFSMMTTLEKQFNERLHETAIGFSIAFSAVMISRLIFQIPLGRLSDRLGRKPLIISGLVFMAPATALLGIVGTTGQLTGLRLLQGIAAAAIAAPAFALAGDIAKSGGEGRQMSIITMGFGLGIAFGPLMAGALDIFSFELPFLVGGVMCLAGAWIVVRWVPETVDRKRPAG